MTAKSEGNLKADISNAIANNNSGDITAEDVRESIKDVVDSIPLIISEADMNASYPFENNVRAKRDTANNLYGLFIAESGIQFPSTGSSPENIQIVAFPGVENLDHGQLEPTSLEDDDHLQYLNRNGQRKMEGNLGLDNYWLNSLGNDGSNTNDKGLQFESVDTNNETIHVGSKTIIEFDDDVSRLDTSKGVAKAWINFDVSSGSIVVNASYNIKKIEKYLGSPGKFIITFRDEIPTPYVAIGSSNARTDSDSSDDFSINTVGIVSRTSANLSFQVLSTTNNSYVDAAVNDLIVFGLSHTDEISETVTTTPEPQ